MLNSFILSFLSKIVVEKAFGAVLDIKEAILDYKNINLIRKLHNWHFCQGISQWYCSNFEISWLSFFLGKIDF